MKKHFIIFQNGKNVNQLKNEANILIKNSHKNLKRTTILNDLSRAISGLSFNKLVSNTKKSSPFTEDGLFYIPFSINNQQSFLKLHSLKICENETQKQYFQFVNSQGILNGIELKLYDLIFIPEYKNIQKTSSGWKLTLNYLKENPFDEEYWIEVDQVDDVIVLNYYVAEYTGCSDSDGYKHYDVLCVQSTFFSNDEISAID